LEGAALRKTFGPKRDDTTRERRKIHNDEHYELCSSPNIIGVIKKNEMSGTCSMYGRQDRCKEGLGGET
jgi:hypothetical protein